MREKDCYFSQETNHTIVERYRVNVLPNDCADEALESKPTGLVATFLAAFLGT